MLLHGFSWLFHNREICCLLDSDALEFHLSVSLLPFFHLLNPTVSSQSCHIDSHSDPCQVLYLEQHILIKYESLQFDFSIDNGQNSPNLTDCTSNADSG